MGLGAGSLRTPQQDPHTGLLYPGQSIACVVNIGPGQTHSACISESPRYHRPLPARLLTAIRNIIARKCEKTNRGVQTILKERQTYAWTFQSLADSLNFLLLKYDAAAGRYPTRHFVHSWCRSIMAADNEPNAFGCATWIRALFDYSSSQALLEGQVEHVNIGRDTKSIVLSLEYKGTPLPAHVWLRKSNDICVHIVNSKKLVFGRAFRYSVGSGKLSI